MEVGKVVKYEKEEDENKVIVYKYDDNGNILDIVEVFECPEWEEEDGKCVRFDTIDPELGYKDSDYLYFEELGISSFDELRKLDVRELAGMIWGEE